LTPTDLERFPEVDFLGFLQAEWNHGHDRLRAGKQRASITYIVSGKQ